MYCNLKVFSSQNCRNIIISRVFCQKLEILDLRYNKISDINILENVNLIELKELKLYKNYY